MASIKLNDLLMTEIVFSVTPTVGLVFRLETSSVPKTKQLLTSLNVSSN